MMSYVWCEKGMCVTPKGYVRPICCVTAAPDIGSTIGQSVQNVDAGDRVEFECIVTGWCNFSLLFFLSLSVSLFCLSFSVSVYISLCLIVSLLFLSTSFIS